MSQSLRQSTDMAAIEVIAAFDFDGTMFDTFESCPGGLGVIEAYEHALRVLGGEAVVAYFKEQGGLQNRAPRQVIADLQRWDGYEGFLSSASRFALRPEGQRAIELGGCHLPSWQVDRGVAAVTELLVCLKLEVLTRQIGTRFPDRSWWPRPTPGFLEFWEEVSEDPHIGTLIVSSGHAAFIERTLELYGCAKADVMVTDDDCRQLSPPVCKPDRALIQLGLARLGVPAGVPVVYYGDDPTKDGMLAENANADFCHFDASGECAALLSFSNWRNAPQPWKVHSPQVAR